MHAALTTTPTTTPTTRVAFRRPSSKLARVRRHATTTTKALSDGDSATTLDNNDAVDVVPTRESSSFGRRAAMTIAAVSMVTPRGAEARLSGGPTGGIPIENFVPVSGWISKTSVCVFFRVCVFTSRDLVKCWHFI